MRNILLIVSPTCGGAERMTILYGKILEKIGYNVEVLITCLPSQQDCKIASFIPSNWKISIVRSRMRMFPYHIICTINKSKPQVVFASSMFYNQILGFAKLFRLIKSKAVVRLNNMPEKFSKVSKLRSRLLLSHTDAIIAQTEEMKSASLSAFHISGNKMHVIYNPLDKDLINEKLKQCMYEYDHQFTNYVAVARVAKQKDYKTMLYAFDIVVQKKPQSRLYIVGDYKQNAIKNELDEIIKERHLQSNVFFIGFTDNPFMYLSAADVFCLSSEIEGLPNAMLEAMYLGKPVVVTQSIPFIEQTVKDGENGFTCAVHDYENFAQCMVNASKIKGLPLYHDLTNSEKHIANLFKNIN